MRICLNMIVRNEAVVIARCLRSVLPHIHCWAVIDTGSQDGTQEIVRDILADLPGELLQRKWVDFSTNRNQALSLARTYGDVALFIDADDTLEVDASINFAECDAASYAFERRINGVSSWCAGLARLDLDWIWRGVLHEVLESTVPHARVKMDGVQLNTLPGGARSTSGVREKYARDAETLRQALIEEPDNTRYQFYLAESLRESGNYAAAFEAYGRHSTSGGSEQQVFISKLMLAVLAEPLGASDAQIIAAYEDAYRFRPQRAETLTRLAHFMIKKERYAEARDYARAACATPLTTDSMSVDLHAYSWKPRDDLAIALLNLSDFVGCSEICREMLGDNHLPESERERVERNLKRALDRSGSSASGAR